MKKRILETVTALVVVAAVANMANAATPLYSNPMNDGSDWHITIARMNYSFGSGILNVSGSSTNAGNIVFVHHVDTRGFSNIVAEFDYRRGGSIVQWESSDWIRFLAYNQAEPPTQASPLAGNSGRWTRRPPDSWTTRAWSLSDTFAANNPNLWVGFQARTTQSGEIIQINNFRVSGTIIDCNGNGVGDNVDIGNGTSIDCNGNAIPDECDIASGFSTDTNRNGIPDECDTIIVNSLEDPGVPDDGLTTLREAIETANGSGGFTITFDPVLVGGTIRPLSQLPAITGGYITIDGDVDGDDVPDIEIDGSLAGDAAHGIRIASSANVINGLVINRFQLEGIPFSVSSPSWNTVSNCYVGVDRIGTSAAPNGSVGIWLHVNSGASDNTLGPGNVVSGNALGGIVIDGLGCSGNRVIESRIGTNVDGTAPIPNGSVGVAMRNGASVNTIGPGNIISGNLGNGVFIGWYGEPCNNNVVENNYIGITFDGLSSLANGSHGVLIDNGATDNVIGPDNVISGNEASGIWIGRAGTADNRIVGNIIGLNATGDSGLGNRGHGVSISQTATNNTVGGLAESDRNIISDNGTQDVWGTGITINGSSGNHVLGNYIGTGPSGVEAFGNGGHGVAIASGATGNTIGPGNVISANATSGIALETSSSNTVVGNLIGLDATGHAALGNHTTGIDITAGASGNQIGGPDPEDMNVISGNSQGGWDVPHWGIFIHGDGTNDNVVQGNRIGTNADGTAAIPNRGVGVTVWAGAKNNVVGGLVPGEGNLISGNQFNGLEIGAPGTSGNQVLGNIIGLDATGMSDLGNDLSGIILVFEAQNHVIEGNVLSGNGDSESWAAGVLIQGNLSNNNVVRDNLIGTDALGSSPVPNSGDGVRIQDGAVNNRIGPGNTVSGNTFFGVLIAGTDTSTNTVHTNLIGTDASGGVAVPNGAPGVMVTNDASGNIIGPGNVISGNNSEGLVLENGAHENTIIGNKCGTDITGSFAIPNFWSGILIQFDGHHNTIGGSGDGEGNLCSGNRASGITVRDQGSDFNQVLGNYCGANVLGDVAIPNGADGIRLNGGARNNTIGPGNVVAWNTVHGVRVDGVGSLGNTITENSISDNVWLGIRLRDGGNGPLAPPTIDAVTENAVSGTSDAPDGSVVELYSDGFNEGDTFLGSTVVQGGAFEFAGVVPSDGFVTATVTDPDGSTSTFGRFGDEPGTRLYGVFSRRLVLLDPFGDTRIIGGLGPRFVRGGFAHRPDGELHLLNEGGNLYQVDPRTGMATLTGNLGYPEVEASAFSADGFLYVAVADEVDSISDDGIVSLDRLVRVHPNSMSATVIGEIGTDIDGMTFLPNGELVGIDTYFDENDAVFSDVYLIDSATGAASFVQALPGFNIIALVHQDDMLLGLDSRGGLVHLDPTAWQSNLLAMLKYLTATLAAGTPPPLFFGDFSGDGYTNLTDYSVFETCLSFSGPGTEPPFQECLDHFDWNDDGDVDLKDTSIFQRAFTEVP